jgi:hypothetical protein
LYAANPRTFVASTGSDSNPCSRTLPCRSFAAAIAQTNAGGEVIVLDSAGYGSVTINTSVSIIAPPGIYAGVTVGAGSNGITVSASASDDVVLRGLVVTGPGTSSSAYGIRVMGSGTVHVEDCALTHLFVGIAIDGADVHIARVTARNNAGAISVIANATTHVISVTDSFLSHNTVSGFFVTANPPNTVDTFLTRVTAIANGAEAFKATTTNAMANVTMTVADSVAMDNGTGVEVDGISVTGNVSGSTLVRNSFADLSQKNNAILRTAGNNATTGGPSDVNGSLMPIGLK